MKLNPTTQQLIAREYRRLSDAKGGTSLDRQGAGNAVAAAENGWTLGEPYIDDGLSASRYARKRRDDFENLIADLSSGPTGRTSGFGADVLMLWESSRGSRKVGEWVSFIELCEAKQVLIWVTTHERLYDPRNGRDRKSLLEDAVDSEYESYKTHVRVTGTTAYEARKGRPHGKAPDGLMPVYDPRTGVLVTWVEDPERSGPVKELFELLEKGHSLAAIEGRFLEAGYLNRSGRPYSREHLRIMALRYAYAGLREHRGEIYEGVWDGIVPVRRFWNVNRILTAPARKTTRGGRARHELTAGLWCGVCGRGCTVGLVGRQRGRAPVYKCPDGCVSVQKRDVDEFVIGTREEPGAMMAYLARADLYRLLAAPDVDEAEVREVQAQLARERAELEKMEKASGRTLAEVEVLARSVETMRAEVKRLEERERELTLPPVVLKFIQPGLNVWESWEAAPVSARRELVRIVLSERGLGRVFVTKAEPRGPRQTADERLDFRRYPAPAGRRQANAG
ncbi:recombinase family protein [Streptomyces sp. G1]|uniref:recombinase family protein n=1 Tax=Streptomyces sp. G1 TaxID=361572 RepID=UPI00202EC24F|nr:recombinase family protein [Streptomyces sp. G1]MCM1976797.1 recombinase family protein [Streptomyces sp. G1]